MILDPCRRGAHVPAPPPDQDLVAVTRGRDKPQVRLDNDQLDAVCREIMERQAHLPQKLGAGFLQIVKKLGVIDMPERIQFVSPNPDGSVKRVHEWSVDSGQWSVPECTS